MNNIFTDIHPLELSIPLTTAYLSEAWQNSPFFPLVNQNNQNKGRCGVHIVKQLYGQLLLQDLDIINNNGDLLNLIDGSKREVKTAFSASGKHFWFNQIRMMQGNEWLFLDLVFIEPTLLALYSFTRDQVLQMLVDDCPLISDGHIGVDNLEFLQIKVKSNSKTNHFPLLSTYGNHVITISSDVVKVNAEYSENRN